MDTEPNEWESKKYNEKTEEVETTSFTFVLAHEKGKTPKYSDQETHSDKK